MSVWLDRCAGFFREQLPGGAGDDVVTGGYAFPYEIAVRNGGADIDFHAAEHAGALLQVAPILAAAQDRDRLRHHDTRTRRADRREDLQALALTRLLSLEKGKKAAPGHRAIRRCNPYAV